MKSRANSKTLTPLGERIQSFQDEDGIGDTELALLANIGRTTLYRIKTVEGQPTTRIQNIAKALGRLTSELEGDLAFETYDLTSAPVCDNPYLLLLSDSKQLGIKEFPSGPVKIEIVPYIESDQRFVKYLFRYNGQSEALIVEAYRAGKHTQLIPAELSGVSLPESALPSEGNGKILGALFDIASLRHLFVR